MINPTSVKRTGDFSSSELTNVDGGFFLLGGRGSYEGCGICSQLKGDKRGEERGGEEFPIPKLYLSVCL
jgi:hypothetical protein